MIIRFVRCKFNLDLIFFFFIFPLFFFIIYIWVCAVIGENIIISLSDDKSLVFCVVLCSLLLSLFLFVIVFSVLYHFTSSDNTFAISKLLVRIL